MSMTPAEMREMAAKAAFSYLEPLTLRNIAAGARDRILVLPLPDTTAADDAEASSAPNVMMCRICGFVIDTRYKAEKPTVDFTTAGRAKKRQPTAADEALEKALEALNDLVSITDAAGLHNLTRGVQLGPTVWYVKASEAMDYARSVLDAAKAKGGG